MANKVCRPVGFLLCYLSKLCTLAACAWLYVAASAPSDGVCDVAAWESWDGEGEVPPGCDPDDPPTLPKVRNTKVVDAKLYDVLGVEVSASQQDIRKAFRELSKKYHPDKTFGDEAKDAKYLEILQAYEVLGSEMRRRIYDEEGLASQEVAEWLNALHKDGPAVAFQRLHRLRYSLRELRANRCIADGARESMNALKVCHEHLKKTSDKSGMAARRTCENKVVMEKEQDLIGRMMSEGVKRHESHWLAHIEVIQNLREVVFNITQMQPELWSHGLEPAVSFGLLIAVQSASKCLVPNHLQNSNRLKRGKVAYMEVGRSHVGASVAVVQALASREAGKPGLAVSVTPDLSDRSAMYDDEVDGFEAIFQTADAARGLYEDDEQETLPGECEKLSRWIGKWGKEWPSETLELERWSARKEAGDASAQGPPCGPARRAAAAILAKSVGYDAKLLRVNARSLEAIGAKALERRRWFRRFGIVHLHASNASASGLLADVILATQLLRPHGILIIDDWLGEAMNAMVPGLHVDQNGGPVQLTLRVGLDHLLVPFFQTWRQSLYIVPDEEKPLLEGGSLQLEDDDGEAFGEAP